MMINEIVESISKSGWPSVYVGALAVLFSLLPTSGVDEPVPGGLGDLGPLFPWRKQLLVCPPLTYSYRGFSRAEM